MAELQHMNLVFIGHVDAGKSTSVGRLLFETGAIPEQTIRKLREEAERIGKQTFEYAFVMDTHKEERERGVTIDVSHKEFKTGKYHYTIIDAPGHRDFVKNMITGASQADAAVLVVSVKDGVQPQTKEHAFLSKVLGINQFLVAINKMDAVGYDQAKYNAVKSDIETLLKGIGYKLENVQFIPISAYGGDNIAKKSDKATWYTGPTLLEVLDSFKVPPKPVDKPLRIPIQDVYTITGHGTVPVGRVEAGFIKAGTKIIVKPSGAVAEVKAVQMHHQEIPIGNCGDNIGFNLKSIDKKDIKRGDVVGDAAYPPKVAKEFKAQIVVLQHPTAISVGYTPVMHIHTAQFAGQIIGIEGKDFLKTGDAAVVKIKPLKPIAVERYQDFPALGRFAIRDMGATVAAGVILEITE